MKKLLLFLLGVIVLSGCEMDDSEYHNQMDKKYEIRVGTSIDTSRGTVYIRLTDSFCEITYERSSDSSYVKKHVYSIPNIISVTLIK